MVIDCTYIYSADYTAAKVISSLLDDFNQRKQKLIFFNLKPNVAHIFDGLNVNLTLCYNTTALTQALSESEEGGEINLALEPDIETGVRMSTESLNSASTVDVSLNVSTDKITKL